jgi:HAMP domain-containing protein
MQPYSGQTVEEAGFSMTRLRMARRLVYYQRHRAFLGSGFGGAGPAGQQLALTIAAPLLAMIAVLFVLAVVLVRLSLKGVTASLEHLALASKRIAGGQLDNPLPVVGEDEVGQLRRSFEQMRVSLKSRMDELNRLLLASQGVASSLEVDEAVKPVLEAALAMGGSSARVVLEPATVPRWMGMDRFDAFWGQAGSDIQRLSTSRCWRSPPAGPGSLANLGRTRLITSVRACARGIGHRPGIAP